LGRYLREPGLINRVSQKGVSRLGMSGIWRNGKESCDCCQCDDMRDVFFHVFFGLLLSFSLRPTTPLESAQQFCFFQANTEQNTIRNNRANLSDILAELL
jgi:hypothetical protein